MAAHPLRLVLLAMLAQAPSCSVRSPEESVLDRAGVPNLRLSCNSVPGTGTPVGGQLIACSASLDSTSAAVLVARLGLQWLPDSVVAQLGTLAKSAPLPEACGATLQTALASPAHITGVFGSPRQLYEPAAGLQYEELIVATSWNRRSACLLFKVAYG